MGPSQNPQYTRAHFGGEAVGCSPTPQHTTMSPRKRNTITTIYMYIYMYMYMYLYNTLQYITIYYEGGKSVN